MDVFDIALQSAVSFSDVDARPDTLSLVATVAKAAAQSLDDYFSRIIAATQEKNDAGECYRVLMDNHIPQTMDVMSDVWGCDPAHFTYEG